MTTSTGSAPARRRRKAQPQGLLLEVQALRTIAVLIVVVYHVWPFRLPGGFVGVDVFFVISGFLITAHLLREVQRTGTISVSAFWARRIRRLLPASLLVLGICAVLLWTVYPEVFRWSGMQQIAFAGVYALNWLLASNSVDYLRAGDSATLVRHFWSLSVEEQFYVLWPLAVLLGLFIAARAARATKKSVRPDTLVLVVASVIVAASFVYSILWSQYNPAFAYYDTGTRAWELGLGAVFAAVLARWPHHVERIRAAPILARGGVGLVAGFVVIAASSFLISPDLVFPGWVAIFPTLGALMVIASGMPLRSWMRPLIGWRPVQYVGDISYELYLVHWPLLITFGVLFAIDPNWWQGLVLIALSVLLAGLMHRGLSQLPRVWKAMWARRRVAFAFAASGALLLGLGAAGTLGWQQDRIAAASEIRDRLAASAGDAAPGPDDPLACVGASAMLSGADCADRFALPDDVDLAAAASDLDRANWCLTSYDQDWLQCERGDPAGRNGVIALLGDSHAAAWTGAMDAYFTSQGWKVVTYTRFGCSGLEQPNPALSDETDSGKMWKACVAWSERARADIAQRDDIDAVVFTNWQLSKVAPGPGQPARLTPAIIASSLDQLGATGKPLVYVEDPPNTVGTSVPECLAGAAGSDPPCATERSVRYDPSLMLDGIAASGLDIGYVPTVDAYCDVDTCYSIIGGVVVYTDDNHISDTWARSLMPYIGPEILARIKELRGS